MREKFKLTASSASGPPAQILALALGFLSGANLKESFEDRSSLRVLVVSRLCDT